MIDAGREEFLATLNVSRETIERLDTYAELVEKWNPAINLVSKGSLKDLWARHFRDSAQIFKLSKIERGVWADFGSGGGFPGLVIAILAAELAPNVSIVCVESDVRKATFLRTVIRETGIAAKVMSERIEALLPLGAEIISARALASLDDLIGYAAPHLAKTGRCLFLKGATFEKERAEALENWRFSCEDYSSETDSEAVILKIGAIERV
ncbi:MAG: 16S rRNA (guanine(527)-N(7))-methyltransferase RsmG [Paracoccaceae bacterium]